MKTKSDSQPLTVPRADLPLWLDLVHERVRGLRFGVVQIVVHEGRVTQVDSTERVRLPVDSSPLDR